MTLKDVLDLVDESKHNTASRKIKCYWLNQIESEIYDEVIATHEGGDQILRPDIREDSPDDTEMLIPDKYAEVYVYWLGAKIDYQLHEYARFNNSNAMFEAEYAKYRSWYNREHMPKQPTPVWF